MAGGHAHANFERVVNPMKKLGLLFLFLFASNALAAYSPGVFIADPTTPANQAKVTASTPVGTDKALVCSLHPNSAAISISGTVPVSGAFWQATQPVSASSWPLPTGAATSANQTTANTSLGSIDSKITTTANGIKVDVQSTTAPKAPVNATASASQNASITTTASTLTAPANAIGFQLSNDSVSSDCVRYRIGGTASSSAGIQLYPTDVTPEIHSGSNISIAACSGTQTVNVQWISQ